MGLRAWVAELSSRLCWTRKNEGAERVAPLSPSRSPQSMERLFLEDMVRVCSELTSNARMDFGIVGQDLQVFKYTGEDFEIHNLVFTESLNDTAYLPTSPLLTHATVDAGEELTPPVPSFAEMCQISVPHKKCSQDTIALSASLSGRESASTTPLEFRQRLSSRTLHRKDFTSIKHLGKGCFGDVWLVFDTITERYLAMKIINKAKKAGMHEHIFEEQRIGREVTGSKWLLPIEGSFEDEENFYMLMEFAPGGDLYTRVHDHSALSDKALKLLLPEMVLAVEEMHKQGMIHRDLKLDNFLLDAEGHIKLADFGISKAFNVSPEARPWKPISPSSSVESKLDVSKLTLTLAGTPGYIAPEISSGRPYGFAADIFSLGVVFYKLIVGRLPFGVHCAMPVKQVAARVETAPLEFTPHIKSCTRNLLSMMLDKDPATRITLREIKAHPYFDTIEWRHVKFQQSSQERRELLFRGTLPQYIRPTHDITRFPGGNVRTKIIHPWFWYTAPGLQPFGSEPRPVRPLCVQKPSQNHKESVSRIEGGRPRYRHVRSLTTDDKRSRRVAMIYE